jgi:hypothetical protein
MDNRLTPARIALLYAAFASIWVFASDKLLALALPDPELILRISLLKGFAFVIITTLLLYLLLQTLVIQTARAYATNTAGASTLKVRNLIIILVHRTIEWVKDNLSSLTWLGDERWKVKSCTGTCWG